LTDKNTFIARHQAGLSYLVIGAFFALKFLQIFGYGSTDFEADDLKEIVMVVVLFWFMRERGAKPEDSIPSIPKGAAGKTVVEESTKTEITTDAKGEVNEEPRKDNP
jgi:hypothetical protein